MKGTDHIASKEDIIKALQKLSEKLGKTPTWVECVNLSEIPMSRLTKYFGTLNKALVIAELPVNRIRAKKAKGYTTRNSHRTNKYKSHKPVFTPRVCNVCDRKFQAEDDMRSCPTCTTTKKSADRRGLSDTCYGIGYLT